MKGRLDVVIVSLPALNRLDDAFEDLAELVLAEHSTGAIPQKLMEASALLAGIVESAHRRTERRDDDSGVSLRRAPSESERYARAVLRTALTRIEHDPACFATEARTLVRFVREKVLDGVLVRRALVDAARAAGMAPDEIDRVLGAVAREAA